VGDAKSKDLLARFIVFSIESDLFANAGVKSDSYYYLDVETIQKSAFRVFVDGGGYDGDTLREFFNVLNERGETNSNIKYYFFEPDENLAAKAKQISNDPRIIFSNIALSNMTGKASFAASEDGTGHFCDKGNVIVHTDTLDRLIKEPISFIKLDVEGAESAVLEGARNHIAAEKPVLAVSAYHNVEDIISLSRQIKSYNDSYKFFIRCGYESLMIDMVLLAI
jgi:FkbM family methyltransferase